MSKYFLLYGKVQLSCTTGDAIGGSLAVREGPGCLHPPEVTIVILLSVKCFEVI